MIRLDLWVHGWVQSWPAKALGWTLVHSLWEGAAITLALAMVLGVARSSKVRYWAACAAMLGLLAGFGATFYKMAPHGAGPSAVPRLPAAVPPSLGDGPTGSLATPWEALDLLPWLAPIWIAGVLLFQLRYFVSWIAAGRLRRTGVFPAPDLWIAALDGLRARLRISRPVMLLESCFAEAPVVIGHLRPVILMPIGLLTGLPRGQIESILLHELAHIGRADYLVNLMQTVVESLLFYHPAVWWISASFERSAKTAVTISSLPLAETLMNTPRRWPRSRKIASPRAPCSPRPEAASCDASAVFLRSRRARVPRWRRCSRREF